MDVKKIREAVAFLAADGFAVMRSDWGPEATYLCFDVGPLGKAHIHQDKLNINLYKGKEELIYDDGGGQYELSAMRKYAISAHAHNTVLVPLRRGQALPCVQKTEGQTWKIDFDGISYGLDPESLDAGGKLE